MAEELSPEVVAIRKLRAARLAAKKEGKPLVEEPKPQSAVTAPKKKRKK